MITETLEEETKTEVETETTEQAKTETTEEKTTEETKDDFEEDFKEFDKHKTAHKVEQEKEKQEDKDLFSEDIEISTGDEFKLQFFLGLIFSLLDGVHLILYRMFSKYKLEKEDIALDENDRAGLEMYFKTKRVMALINKLPGEIIGLVHIEYIYMQKFNTFTKAQKELGTEEKEQEEEEEEEAEEKEEKKEPQKKRTYKKRKKKKPVKKAAIKKEES